MMIYTTKYNSPLGCIYLASQDGFLISLWIDGQKSNLTRLNDVIQDKADEEVLVKAKKWLDAYFKGEKPVLSDLKITLLGTEFQKKVWNILIDIPYGKVITYNDIAQRIAQVSGIKKMAPQAVGQAVGHNPLSIIVPCHRVIGANGNLVGYGGGLSLKIALLRLEGLDMTKFYVPKK